MTRVRSNRIALLGPLVATLFFAAGCGGNGDGGDPVPSFYTPPDPLPFGQPGDVIKTGGVPDAPAGVRIQRIMYHSRTNDGEDIATTGLLALPAGDPPPGGWPLVAAAHGTTGIVEKCAPSITPFEIGSGGSNYYDFFFRTWVENGYAVVGADYQGEGAPGPYSFLVGKVEAQNVLDSVRAAKRIQGNRISDELILFGHSQGGNSAGWAAQLLPSYAPELTSSGVILAAPAAELMDLLERAYRGGAGATTPAEAVTFLYLALLSYQDSYDGLSVYDIINDTNGVEGLPIFQNVCAETGGTPIGVNEELRGLPGPFTPPDFFVPLSQYPPGWVDAIDLNSLGNQPIETPILMVQGCDDTTIPIQTNFLYFDDALCPNGETVEFTTYPGQSHSGVVTAAFPEMVAWANARLAGQNAPTNCSSPPSCPGS